MVYGCMHFPALLSENPLHIELCRHMFIYVWELKRMKIKTTILKRIKSWWLPEFGCCPAAHVLPKICHVQCHVCL
ncbi:hypothetical protein ACS0TY_021083 [Phlomoides rotata]